MNQSVEMVKTAYAALSDKKGEDIRIIDICKVSVMADYFIIASGTNANQVQAMVDNVEEELGKKRDLSANRWKAISLPTGYSWTTAISSSMCLTVKIVCSMIWKESGEMERQLKLKIWKLYHKNGN